MITVSELEEAYEQAYERLLRGELDDEEFKAEVDRLRYKDEQGRLWKMGWYTGKWYRHDLGQWIQDVPPERQPGKDPLAGLVGERRVRTGRRLGCHSRAVLLGAAIVCLLLVAGVALIAGLNSLNGPAAEVGQAASPSPAATEAPTSTAMGTAGVPISGAAASQRTTQVPAPTKTATAIASATPSRTARATITRTRTPTATATPTPTVTSLPTPTSTRRAAPLPTPLPALTGQIYFPVYDPNPDRRTMDIYAVRLPSGERHIVLGQASQPALSPDGKRLAFRSWDSAQRGIVVRELVDGKAWTWVNYGEAAHPSWGPDSQAIVFASQQESDRHWRLYGTLGLQIDRIHRNGADIFGRVPDWTADGRIVYWECPEDKCGLRVMQADGSAPLRLTMAEHDTAPATSPDGSQVAFMSTRDGNWEIYIVNMNRPEGPEGHGVGRLTDNSARDGLPTWSPDGQWLAFISDRDGAWAAWVTRPDGSNQRKLFDLGGPPEGQIANVTEADENGWTWESLAWGP